MLKREELFWNRRDVISRVSETGTSNTAALKVEIMRFYLENLDWLFLQRRPLKMNLFHMKWLMVISAWSRKASTQ